MKDVLKQFSLESKQPSSWNFTVTNLRRNNVASDKARLKDEHVPKTRENVLSKNSSKAVKFDKFKMTSSPSTRSMPRRRVAG
jgi:hypothetical protein